MLAASSDDGAVGGAGLADGAEFADSGGRTVGVSRAVSCQLLAACVDVGWPAGAGGSG